MSTIQEEATVPSPINPEWLAEFEAAARRPLKQRWKYAFIKTYKPVLDDAPYRSFETMQEIAIGARRICRSGWVTAASEARFVGA